MDKRYKVLSKEVFKSGTSNKNGKSFPWTIYKVTLDGYDGTVTGFDDVNAGDEVTLKSTQNGKYTNTNYEKVDPDKATSSNAGGAMDKRAMKLLVAVADAIYRIQIQVGIPDGQLLDPEKVMEILEQ